MIVWQFPKKYDPSYFDVDRAWAELYLNGVHIAMNVNTEHGHARIGTELRGVDEGHPIIKRLRQGGFSGMGTTIEVISSDVITTRLNPYLKVHGYEFDQYEQYWGLISLSGIPALSILYQDFGRAFDAALLLIATGKLDDLPESTIVASQLWE